jgi:hypothetical protein
LTCARQAKERFPDLPHLLGELLRAKGNPVFDLGRGIVGFREAPFGPTSHSGQLDPFLHHQRLRSRRSRRQQEARFGKGNAALPSSVFHPILLAFGG